MRKKGWSSAAGEHVERAVHAVLPREAVVAEQSLLVIRRHGGQHGPRAPRYSRTWPGLCRCLPGRLDDPHQVARRPPPGSCANSSPRAIAASSTSPNGARSAPSSPSLRRPVELADPVPDRLRLDARAPPPARPRCSGPALASSGIVWAAARRGSRRAASGRRARSSARARAGARSPPGPPVGAEQRASASSDRSRSSAVGVELAGDHPALPPTPSREKVVGQRGEQRVAAVRNRVHRVARSCSSGALVIRLGVAQHQRRAGPGQPLLARRQPVDRGHRARPRAWSGPPPPRPPPRPLSPWRHPSPGRRRAPPARRPDLVEDRGGDIGDLSPRDRCDPAPPRRPRRGARKRPLGREQLELRPPQAAPSSAGASPTSPSRRITPISPRLGFSDSSLRSSPTSPGRDSNPQPVHYK